MARILYIHQYFKTPEEGGSIRSWYIARAMIKEGHEVEMVTAWDGPGTKISERDGIRVHYLPVAYDQAMGTMRRLWAFWRFARQARHYAQRLHAPDLIYATSTPLSVGIPARKLKKYWGVPFIFEVRDLWPEAPIRLGVIRWQWLQKELYELERSIYANADAVIALSPQMAEGVRAVNESVPVHMIPNMADTEYFQPTQPGGLSFTRENPLRIAYTGAAGYSNDIAYICSLAANVQHLPVQFDIMATGAELPFLRKRTADIPSICWHPYGSKEKVRSLLGVCHFSMVLFRQNTILKSNSPNKFFDALAAGKAILVNIPGWVCDLVGDSQCGWYIPRGEEDRLEEKIRHLIGNPDELSSMQAASRALAIDRFDREQLCNQVLEVVSQQLLKTS